MNNRALFYILNWHYNVFNFVALLINQIKVVNKILIKEIMLNYNKLIIKKNNFSVFWDKYVV